MNPTTLPKTANIRTKKELTTRELNSLPFPNTLTSAKNEEKAEIKNIPTSIHSQK